MGERAFRRRAVALLAGAALLALPVPAHAAPGLGHAGRWFTDDSGRAVMLHGVAVMDFTDAHLPEARDAAVLRLRNAPGAAEVRVRLLPR